MEIQFTRDEQRIRIDLPDSESSGHIFLQHGEGEKVDYYLDEKRKSPRVREGVMEIAKPLEAMLRKTSDDLLELLRAEIGGTQEPFSGVYTAPSGITS
jgi:hypothetical protein